MKTKMLFWCMCAGLMTGLSFFTVSCKSDDSPATIPPEEVILSITSKPIDAPLEGNTYNITVFCNTHWTAESSDPTWAAITPESGNNDGEITVTIPENTTGKARAATITVLAGTTSKVVSVKQSGLPTMQAFTPTGSEAVGTTWDLADSRDNKEYSVVKMPDGKIWMAKNLNYTDPTWTNITDQIGSGEYAGAMPTLTADNNYACQTDGGCAFWGAHYPYLVAQRACPEGWSLPNDADWKGIVTGTIIETTKTLSAPNAGTPKYWTNDAGYTNTTKFNAIGAGAVHGLPGYRHTRNLARFWIEETQGHIEWGRVNGETERAEWMGGGGAADSYYSVRCVKK
jgi:uncharacterized protein (TIGR02145 family)